MGRTTLKKKRMSEEAFNLVVDALKKINKAEGELSSLGVNLNHNDLHFKITETLLLEIFTKDKIDTFFWAIYEFRPEKMKIYDSKTKKVLYDVEKAGQLYKYMIS